MQKTKNYSLSLSILFLSTLIAHAQPLQLPADYAQGTPVNYVRSFDVTAPIQDANALLSRPLKDVKVTTQYLDGLGRPIQTVMREGSMLTGSAATDMVSTNVYDEFGREKIKYLPYAEVSLNNGLFKSSPFTAQANFYSSQLTGQVGETSGNNQPNWSYNQTNFEASPLNRPLESFAPGVSWVGSASQTTEANRKSVKMKYWINTTLDAVRIWNVTNAVSVGQFGTYASPGNYPAGELSKMVTLDEHGKQVIEFKDKEGKVVLKKVQIGNSADNGNGVGNTLDWLCTYYLYNDIGQLSCVIQPEGVKTLNANGWVLNSTLLSEQCFRYEYDHRNRMIMKKVPGAGEVYMLYDKRDRLVMMQDANMRVGTIKWMVTKYDALNRPFETGLWNNSTSFAQHITNANNSTLDYPATTGTYDILTITHYDDYNSLPSGLGAYATTWNTHFSPTDNIWPYPQMPVVSNATKGMVTWMQVKVLGTSTFLNTVNYYDDKGRVIQSQSTNMTGGLDVVTTQYSWVGQPLVMVQKQQNLSVVTTAVTKMSYDHLGRLLDIEKKLGHSTINAGTISAYKKVTTLQYDKRGQLKTKSLAPYYNNNAGLESLVFDYNIRGWMLGVNRDYLTINGQGGTSRFGFELGYDKITNKTSRNYTCAVQWKH